MFDINTKVVCIDDRFPQAAKRHLKIFPMKGKVYTIRDIIPAQTAVGGHTSGVLLEEIINQPSEFRPDWGECGFAPNRFRELDNARDAVVSQSVATLTL